MGVYVYVCVYTYIYTHTPAHKQTNKQTNKQTKQTNKTKQNKQKNKQTNKQTKTKQNKTKQTNKQTNRQTDKEIDRYLCVCVHPSIHPSINLWTNWLPSQWLNLLRLFSPHPNFRQKECLHFAGHRAPRWWWKELPLATVSVWTWIKNREPIRNGERFAMNQLVCPEKCGTCRKFKRKFWPRLSPANGIEWPCFRWLTPQISHCESILSFYGKNQGRLGKLKLSSTSKSLFLCGEPSFSSTNQWEKHIYPPIPWLPGPTVRPCTAAVAERKRVPGHRTWHVCGFSKTTIVVVSDLQL